MATVKKHRATRERDKPVYSSHFPVAIVVKAQQQHQQPAMEKPPPPNSSESQQPAHPLSDAHTPYLLVSLTPKSELRPETIKV